MPRCARIKSMDSVYHIMVRSISDTLLFRSSEDKDEFLYLIKEYQDLYAFKVYGYCIMDTHAHIIIDASGADISSIMHGINQSYAQYFNRKYDRRGHLFADRFKSRIVDDDSYLITLSGYIHNNPDDIEEYKSRVEEYAYSSLGIYLGMRKDNLGILDADYIMQFFGRDCKKARKLYLKFVYKCDEKELKEHVEFKDQKTEYRSERRIIARDYTSDEVIDFVAGYTGDNKGSISIKYGRRLGDFKALSILLMRGICSMNERQICEAIGGISQSHASRLCSRGIELIHDRQEYKGLLDNFLLKATARLA